MDPDPESCLVALQVRCGLVSSYKCGLVDADLFGSQHVLKDTADCCIAQCCLGKQPTTAETIHFAAQYLASPKTDT